MNTRNTFFKWLVVAAALITSSPASGQVVAVTMSLETNRIVVGGATTLHVFAQIVPAQRANADRIFSFYVDLLNATGTVAGANYAAMQKPAADKDPSISSFGTTDGANRRGIYDTFMNLAGAGRDTPVELFSVPVQGVAIGRTTFKVQAGTGVPNLAADFIVAPQGGGDPLLGGNYSAASIDLDVVAGGVPCDIKATIAVAALPGGQNQFTIAFPPCAGKNNFVEFRDDLAGGPDWQPLPGSPHNTGSVKDTPAGAQRFYRVRVSN